MRELLSIVVSYVDHEAQQKSHGRDPHQGLDHGPDHSHGHWPVWPTLINTAPVTINVANTNATGQLMTAAPSKTP